MIKKPEGYDESQTFTGESMSLPAGCYVCVIKQVACTETETGRSQIAVLFDVAEGEQKGFYQKQYDAAKRQDASAKWKGVHKQIMDGTSLPFFKGLITSIEKSNNFQFSWDKENNEKTLVGKKFGAIMGREQFEANDGQLKFATKIFQIRSIDGLKDAKVPEDKLLDQSNVKVPPQQQKAQPKPDKDGFMNIPDGIDEELPFM